MAPMHNPEQGIQDKPTSAEPSATAIQTKAPAPPATAAAAPAAIVKPVALPQSSRTSPLDPVLLALLLVFAFLLASFAVANSDFWMHLATGRLIAQGEYQFGHDPFSYASEGPWINQSWLFDWLLYGVYTLGGGTALVVVKALVFVALIMLLFQIRRRDGSWLLPILVLALAALAMHTRLLLQPTILSYLLFAAMLWLLFGEPGPAPTGARRLWWLPGLFALWVNVDSWFIVGPLTLALVLLGSWLQRLTGGTSLHAPKQLAALLGVGLLACLLNPHHIRAFQLPYELAHPLAELGDLLRIPLPDSLVAAGRTMQHVMELDPRSAPIYGVLTREFMQ